MPVNSYTTLRTTLRPPRVACLVDINEKDWQERIHGALESFTRTWGGSHFIIVPTDGKTISNPFWEILSAYDPDYFWTVFRTNDRYEDQIVLSPELIDQIITRLAPFHFKDDPYNHLLKNNILIKQAAYPNFYSAEYPFTDIFNILPHCEHLSRFIKAPALDGMMKVWATSVTGLFGANTKEELQKNQIEPVEILPDDFLKMLIDTVVDGVIGNPEINDDGFPFAFSSPGLAFVRSTQFFESNELTIIVTGDSLEDFCLYFCLSRMRRKVAWLLPEWLPSKEDENDYDQWFKSTLYSFVDSLKKLAGKYQGDERICLVSIFLSEERVGEIREMLNDSPRYLRAQENLPVDETGERATLDFTEHLSAALRFLLRFPIRVFGTGNALRPSSQPVMNSRIAGMIEPPLPKKFDYTNPFEHYWVTEISMEDYHFPRHPLLGTEIIKKGAHSSWDVRSGKEGIVYFSPRSGRTNSDIEHIVQPFFLELPDAITVFTKLFNNLKYRVEISDKGRFGLTTISKFGSIESTAYFLLVPHQRAIFEKYISGKSKTTPRGQNTTVDEGMFLKSDSRWYLDFKAINEFVKNESRTSDLIYKLSDLNILYRGLILKCFVCRNTDWFSVAEITHEFKCKRCGYSQKYNQFHSLNKLEPSWFYKLDEVVFNAMRHNCDVPLLTLYQLKKKSKVFDFSPEIELIEAKTGISILELDICCISDGEIIIGECKKGDSLGKSKADENTTITKYLELAEKIGASKVVFSTYSEEWKESTLTQINKRFSASFVKPIVLVRKDLIKEY